MKEGQRRVIVELMKKHDVFAILPTGYGKSLCYACTVDCRIVEKNIPYRECFRKAL